MTQGRGVSTHLLPAGYRLHPRQIRFGIRKDLVHGLRDATDVKHVLDFGHYNTDVEAFRATRREILELLSAR